MLKISINITNSQIIKPVPGEARFGPVFPPESEAALSKSGILKEPSKKILPNVNWQTYLTSPTNFTPQISICQQIFLLTAAI
jgi:hypothetical protein